MQVTIDGIDYVPASDLSRDANKTAKAIIRGLISGFYDEPSCHMDGYSPKPSCECSACRMYAVALAFVGGAEAKAEPIVDKLMSQTSRH